MPSSKNYARDLIGYNGNPPNPFWPNDARIAVQFVLNYEEGGENCILHGDDGAETFLSEIINALNVYEQRHMSMESLFEYGSRVGVWRILKAFEDLEIPITVFAVGSALERHPTLANYLADAGHEICGHGYKWIDYQNIPENEERRHYTKTIEIIERLTGQRPVGWYTGRTSPNTARIVSEDKHLLYHSDDYSDDLPFWTQVYGVAQLVIPYALDTNDMKFSSVQGFNCGDQFYSYLKDSFDTLYEEGQDAPKMMTIGLHCRISGRPARTASLRKFLKYVKSKNYVWICQRVDIARHWKKVHPPKFDGEN